MKSPEELLYTLHDGTFTSLERVIDDGLDLNCSGPDTDRIAGLCALMDGDESPEYRRAACRVLASWGHPRGCAQIVEWANHPNAVPWAEPGHLMDSSFSMFSDALRRSHYAKRRPGLDEDRARVAAALLGVSNLRYVGDALALELHRDAWLCGAVDKELRAAVLNGLVACRSRSGFDVAYQTACLVGVIAQRDDAFAARAADGLLAMRPVRRVVKAVITSMGLGRGPATLSVLQRLSTSRAHTAHVAREIEYRRGLDALDRLGLDAVL